MLLFFAKGSAQTVLKGRVVIGSDSTVVGDIILTPLATNNQPLLQSFTGGSFQLNMQEADSVLFQLITDKGADTSFVIRKTGSVVYDLGVIDLITKKQLETITVTAKVPIYQRTEEGNRLNVANTILAASNNPAELLSKLPGTMIQGGKINVMGKGEAILYMEGKELPFEAFKSIPVSEIKAIEIISNPGPAYDARGKAVIVIYTKRSYYQGIAVTLSESATLGIRKGHTLNSYFLNTANLSINARKKRWGFNGFYANESGNSWNENKTSVYIKGIAGTYTTNGYYNETSKSKAIHTYRFGVAYNISQRSDLSLQYDGLSHFFNLDVMQNNDYYKPDLSLNLIRMRNDATTRLLNHSLNANYNLKLDTIGVSHVFIGAQYNQFNNHLLDNISETITNSGVSANTSQRINEGVNGIEILSFQSDLVRKFKAFTVESGIKFSRTTNTGKVRFFSKSSGTSVFTENLAVANTNHYKELVPAAYALLKGTSKSLSYMVGVRAEYSEVSALSGRFNHYIIDSSYFNLFPSASLKYTMSDNWSCKLNYTHKISRPVYQDLDPFLWYLDSLTSIQGNPGLIPELLHQFEHTLTYKGFSFRTAYTLSKGTMWAIAQTSNSGDNSVKYVKDNIQQRELLLFSFDVPYESTYFNLYYTLAYNMYKFTDNRPQYAVNGIRPQFYLYASHQIVLPKQFSIDINTEYYGASSDGFTNRKPYYYLTFGCSKSLRNDKLNVQILFNDVLRSAAWQGIRTLGTFTNVYNQRINSHFIRLAITYKLGGVYQYKYANKTIIDKEYGRIKQ